MTRCFGVSYSTGAQAAGDPAVRVGSVEVLCQEKGAEVRDALSG